MPKYAKLMLVCLSLLAIFGIWQTLRTQYYINLGVQLAEQALPYEQHPANPTAHILVIGDSTAVGTGANQPADSIAGLIGQDYPKADITNLGQNGARLADLPDRFTRWPDDQFDLVVVMIGGNDVWRLTSFTNIEDSLKTVLADAKRVGKEVIILHGGDFGTAKALPLGTRRAFSWRSAQLRELYARLAPAAGARYIDLWDIDHNHPERAAQFYAPDHFHPSSSGYADWYQEIRPVLHSVLEF